MRKGIFYLLIIVEIISAASCKKDEEQSEAQKQEEKESLLCKSWLRTYLTIDSDTSYSENWIFEREFFKDKTYIMHITRLGDNGDDEYAADYIHQNPVRDMLVEKPEEYLFSSARNYAELPSLLDIILETQQLKTYG